MTHKIIPFLTTLSVLFSISPTNTLGEELPKNAAMINYRAHKINGIMQKQIQAYNNYVAATNEYVRRINTMHMKAYVHNKDKIKEEMDARASLREALISLEVAIDRMEDATKELKRYRKELKRHE